MQEKFEEILEIAKKAGKILHGYFGKAGLNKKMKEGCQLVTEADIASQDFIVSKLKKKFPDFGILSEEGINEIDFEKIWVIDPLDGTDNFVSGNPNFSVSIALTDKNLKPGLGVVYAPVLDKLFYSFGNGVSYCNKKKISVKKRLINESVLGLEFTTNQELKIEALKLLSILVEKGVIRIRMSGSAALSICYTASGIFDGYFHLRLNPWDFSAARLILENAGGKFLFKKEEKQKYSVIGGNNQMFNLLRGTLKL